MVPTIKIKSRILLLLIFAAAPLYAQKATVRTVYSDGKVTKRTVSFSPKKGYSEFFMPKSALSGIDTLEITPSFAVATAGEEGYFIAPDGYKTGFLTGRPDTLRAVYRKHPLGMVGIKTPRGCWVEMVESYRFDMRLCTSHKAGVYTSSIQYILKNIEPYADLVLKVYSLKGDDADYSGMARLYRKLYVEGKIKPLAERAAANPLLKYAIDNPEIRLRQAWKPLPTLVPDQTRENEPAVRVKITFDRCREIVDALRNNGVNGAQLTLVGWNLKGHDGRFPTLFPPEITLGGETALKKLIKYTQQQGYQIVPHICTGDSYKVSEDFDERDLAIQADGSFSTQFIYSSGRMYQLCNKVTYEKFIQPINDTLRAYGFRGIEYNDVYSIIPPLSCHSHEHPVNPLESTEYIKKILSDGAQKIGGIASEGGYDHVASVLDFALYVSMSGPGTNFGRLKDEYLPIWHIIYNGYIFSCPFAKSVNYPIKPTEHGMKIMEYGCHPTFYFYSAHRDDKLNWIGTKELDLKCETAEELETSARIIRQGYDYLKEYGYIQYLTMDRHEALSPGVYCTTFSDGTRTVCNYSDKTFTFEGVEIASSGWHIFKAEKQ